MGEGVMGYTPAEVKTWKGIDLQPAELEAVLEPPSRMLGLIAELVSDANRPSDPKPKIAKGPDGENATELKFCAQRIEPLRHAKLIDGYQFIGTRRSHGLPITARRKYTPDYRIDLDPFGLTPPIYVECKGQYFSNPRCEKLYQAAKIRLDVAAEKYDAVFILAVKNGRGWDVTRVKGKGDGINVPDAVLRGLGVIA